MCHPRWSVHSAVLYPLYIMFRVLLAGLACFSLTVSAYGHNSECDSGVRTPLIPQTSPQTSPTATPSRSAGRPRR